MPPSNRAQRLSSSPRLPLNDVIGRRDRRQACLRRLFVGIISLSGLLITFATRIAAPSCRWYAPAHDVSAVLSRLGQCPIVRRLVGDAVDDAAGVLLAVPRAAFSRLLMMI